MRIKSEVDHAMKNYTEKRNLNDTHSDVIHREANINNDGKDILIDSLRSEINFLRSEIKSKDKIIEMIINDGSTQNRTNINNRTEQKVLKPTQESNIQDSFTYNITENVNTKIFRIVLPII